MSVIRTPPLTESRALSFDLGLKSRLKCVHDIYQLGLEFAEVLRFICRQRLLVRQIALVLNRKLVDTVGHMLVDLTDLNHHVAD